MPSTVSEGEGEGRRCPVNKERINEWAQYLGKGERKQGKSGVPFPDLRFPLGSPVWSQWLDQVPASSASIANILTRSSPEYGQIAGWVDTGIYAWRMDG